ncbi:MAG: T9SS type A sorting domain-containing protein [Bacteroidia bacterium]|nr:T9SS type A sorting domain-containing protein [Bacteroidia bacterium]
MQNRQLDAVGLQERTSIGGVATGKIGDRCFYQSVPGFVECRQYLISFCRDRGFTGTGNNYDTYLLIQSPDLSFTAENDNDSSGCTNSANTSGASTLSFIASNTGSLRFFIFKQPDCQGVNGGTEESVKTIFGYKETCKAGNLKLLSLGNNTVFCDSSFSLEYSCASGAQNYQLEVSYDNGLNWIEYTTQPWQNISPIYLFRNIKINKSAVFRVKHLGGNCAETLVLSNQITISVNYICPRNKSFSIQTPKRRYCGTSEKITLFIADTTCFPPDAQYHWQGPIQGNFSNQASVAFNVPNFENEKVSCKQYTYSLDIVFPSIAGCTLKSEPLTIDVCRLIPHRVIAEPPTICQGQNLKASIQIREEGWPANTLSEAIQNNGYRFIWEYSDCVPAPIENILELSLACTNFCGGFKDIVVRQIIEGCVSPQLGQVEILCQGNANFDIQPATNTPICIFPSNSRSTVTVRANIAPAPQGVTYLWDCDNCITPPPPTPGPHALSWATPGTKTIRLTAFSPAPCSTHTVSRTVIIQAPPSGASIRCGINGPMVCTNTSLSVQIQHPDTNRTYNYSWRCPGCLPPPTGSSANIRWNTPGTKTVTVFITSSGCPNDTITLECNPIIISAANANFNISPNPICINQAATISLASPVANATYSWNCQECVPNINSHNTAGPFQVSWQNGGNKTIQVTALRPPCPSNSETKTITVYQLAPVKLSVKDTTLCQNQELFVSASLLGQAFGTSWSWNCEGCSGLPSNNTSTNARLSWQNSGTYKLVVCAHATPCSPSCDTAQITVVNRPTNNIIVSQNVICVNQSMTLNTQNTANTTFSWNCSNCEPSISNVSSAGPFIISWQNGGIKTVQLTTTHPVCGTSTNSITVTVNSLPDISLSTTSNSICAQKEQVTITPQITGGFGSPRYAWTCSNCTTPSTLPNSPTSTTFSWNSSGIKNVTLCASNLIGCTSAIKCDSVLITVNPLPTLLNIQIAPSPLCSSDSLLLTFNQQPSNTKVWISNCQNCNLQGDTLYSNIAYLRWSNPGIKTITLNAILGKCTLQNPETRVVSVNSNPQPILTLPSSNVCQGNFLSTGVTTNAIGVVSYSWSCNGCKSSQPSFQENQWIPRAGPFNLSWDTPGVKKLKVCTQVPGCDTTCSDTTINVNSLPQLPNIIPPEPRCGVGTVTFVLSGPSTTENQIFYLYTQSAGIAPVATYLLSPSPIPWDTVLNTPTISTTTRYYYNVYSPTTTCTSATNSFVARVNPALGNPSIATNTTCIGSLSSFTAEMGVPAGNTFRLYTQPRGDSFIASYSGTIWVFSTLLSTTTTYYIEAYETSSRCTSMNRLPIVLNIAEPPEPPIAYDTLTCGNLPFSIRIIPSATTDSIKVWDSPHGGRLISAHAKPFEANIIQVPSQPSTIDTLYLEAINSKTNPPCPSITRTPVKVIRIPLPAPPILETPLKPICGKQTLRLSFKLQDTLGNQVILLDNQDRILGLTNTRPYQIITPIITQSVNWKVIAVNTVAGCTSTSTTLPIEHRPLPGSPLSRSESRCGGGKITFLAIPTTSYGIHIRLYTTPAGGQPIFVDSLPAYELTTPWLFANETFFIAAYNPSTGCESERTMVLATIHPRPPAPSVQPIRVCQKAKAQIDGNINLTPPFNILLYEPQGSFRTASITPFRFDLPELTTTTTYHIQAQDANLCFSDSLPIIAEVIPKPLPPIAPNLSRCGPGTVSFSVNLVDNTSSSSDNNKIVALYASANSTSPISTSSTPFTLFTPWISTHTTFYLRTQHSGFNCSSEPIEVPIRIHASIPNLNVISDFRCSTGSFTFTLGISLPPGTQVHIYSTPQDEIPIQTIYQFPFIFSTPLLTTTTTYYYEAEDRGTGCRSSLKAPIIMNFQDSLNSPPLWEKSYFCSQPQNLSTTARLILPAARKYNTAEIMIQEEISNFLSSAQNFSLADTLPFSVAYQTQPMLIKARGVIPQKGCYTTTSSTQIYPAPQLAPSQNVPSRCGSGPIAFTIVADTFSHQVVLYESSTASIPSQIASSRPFSFTYHLSSSPKILYAQAVNIQTGCTSPRQPIKLQYHTLPPTPKSDTLARCQAGILIFTFVNPSNPHTVMRLYRHFQDEAFIQQSLPEPNNGIFLVSTPFIHFTQTYYVKHVDLSTGCQSNMAPIVARIDYLPRLSLLATSRGCLGDTLYLEARGQAAEYYHFLGPNGWDTLSQQGKIRRVGLNPAKRGVYSLIAILGTCTTAPVSSNFVEVREVYPRPIVAPLPNTSFCEEKPLLLSVANSPVFPVTAQFQWRTPFEEIGLASDTLIILKLNPQKHNGIYQARAIVEGCTTQWSPPYLLSVASTPHLQVPEILEFCQSRSRFQLAVLNPDSSTFYQWQGPNNFYDTGPVISRLASISNAGIYTITARSSSGCYAPPQTIQVRIRTQLPIDSIVEKTRACIGTPFKIYLKPSYNHWQGYWLTPNGKRIESTSLEISQLQAQDAGIYTLTLEDPVCGTYTLTYYVVPQHTPPSPSARIEEYACLSLPTRIEASFIVGASYFWQGPNGFQSTLRTPMLPPQTPNGIYSVQAIVEGCTSLTTSLTVLRSQPQLKLANSPSSICAYNNKIPLSFEFHGELPITWQYSLNGELPTLRRIEQYSQVITFPVSPYTTIFNLQTLALVDSRGCPGITDSLSFQIPVKHIPSSSININIGAASVCEKGWVLLESQEPNILFYSEGLASPAPKLLIDNLSPGNYAAQYYFSSQGCTATLTYVIPQVPLPQITHLETSLEEENQWIDIRWPAVVGANKYSLRFRTENTPYYTLLENIEAPHYRLRNVVPNQRYFFELQVHCENGKQGPFSEPATIRTLALPTNCPIPIDRFILEEAHQVSYRWKTVPGAYCYQVHWRDTTRKLTSQLVTIYAPDTFFIFPLLIPRVVYGVKIRALCNAQKCNSPQNSLNSAWSEETHFIYRHANMRTTKNHQEEEGPIVYPNPSLGEILVEKLPLGATLCVIDITGRIVIPPRTITQTNTSLDLSSAPEGWYILKIFNKEETKVIKVYKQN